MNDFSYTAFGPSQYSSMVNLGFVSWSESTDSLFRIADRKSQNLCEGCNDLLARPSYVTFEMAPNWPHLTYQEARKIVRIEATYSGASDGWSFPEDAL